MELGNLYRVGDLDRSSEVFEKLSGNEMVEVERIVSTGQSTPAGEWLVQEKNEFVVLLSGRAILKFEDGKEVELVPGDHLTIPANLPHRVDHTQTDPCTIWLAVHY